MPIFSIKEGGRRVFGLNLAGAPWNVVFGKIYSIYTTNFILPTLKLYLMTTAPLVQLEKLRSLRKVFSA